MPDTKFLESYPLYRKFDIDIGYRFLKDIPQPPIRMHCQTCNCLQTFKMKNCYYDNYPHEDRCSEKVIRIVYQCAACNEYQQFFLLKFGDSYIMKVGQYPPWDITPDKNLVELL